MTHSGHSDIGKYEKAALALSGDRSMLKPSLSAFDPERTLAQSQEPATVAPGDCSLLSVRQSCALHCA